MSLKPLSNPLVQNHLKNTAGYDGGVMLGWGIQFFTVGVGLYVAGVSAPLCAALAFIALLISLPLYVLVGSSLWRAKGMHVRSRWLLAFGIGLGIGFGAFFLFPLLLIAASLQQRKTVKKSMVEQLERWLPCGEPL